MDGVFIQIPHNIWMVCSFFHVFINQLGIQTGVISRGGSGGGAPLVKISAHVGGANILALA